MKKITLLLFLAVGLAYSQKGVYFQSSIDPKMIFIGDDSNGIKKGTIDASFRFIMEGNQQKYGYIIAFPEFTYRNTDGNLKSYTANVGYTFNELIIPRSEIGVTIGYGWIDHYGMTTFSFTSSQSYGLKITDKFKLVLISEFRDRTDLKHLYGKDKIGWSVRAGFEIKIF